MESHLRYPKEEEEKQRCKYDVSQWLLIVLKEPTLIRPFLEKEIEVGHMLGFHKHQHTVKLSTGEDLNLETAFITLKAPIINQRHLSIKSYEADGFDCQKSSFCNTSRARRQEDRKRQMGAIYLD